MKNHNIANIQLKTSENCSELEKEILQFYWEIEELEFTNTVKKLKNTYNITQGELTKLNDKYSEFSLYVLCENCDSYEKHIIKSQSKFKETIKLTKGKWEKPFKCNHCIDLQQTQIEEENRRKNKELVDNLKIAIENKNWNNLSKFERALLVHCLEKSFNQIKINDLIIVKLRTYGFLFKLKNFIDGENVGATPFIPYMFIWELYDF